MTLDKKIKKRIDNKKAALDKMRPLSPSLVKKLHEQVVVEWTYNSNALEGTTLSLNETELIIEQGLTIKGKPLKEHFEAINHKDAILYIEGLIKPRNVRFSSLIIRQIHEQIFKNIDSENAGRYREVNVKITGSKQTTPSPVEIPPLMRDFEVWLQNKNNAKNIINFAALAHYKLAVIHPFIDGNGRTARLLMNLILMNKGYPPTLILKADRKKYVDALKEASKGNTKPFVDFIGRSVERSLTWYLDAVTPEKEKKESEKLVLLSKLTRETGYSQEYLSLLARRGKIEAIKKNRNWYSTLDAVEKYKNSHN